MDLDVECMRYAIRLAREAQRFGNLPIGAVITLAGEVVAEGRNSIWVPDLSPSGHAEMEALHAASPGLWTSEGQITIYTTLEPCPMCLGAILAHPIDRVVFGSSDNRAGASCLLDYLPPAYERRRQTLEWIGPALPDECDELNELVATLLMEHRGRI
jgi:tRNA(adenine34) deaminase